MILTIENLKDNKRQLEDNNSSNLHDMATVQFLDQQNVDNNDIGKFSVLSFQIRS